MRVLIHGYNNCCQNASGGVQVRIRKFYDLLSQSGVIVDYFNPFQTQLKDYDILHVFSLNYETYSLIVAAKNMGLKIVISAIAIPQKRKIRDDIRNKLIELMHYTATIEYLTKEIARIADVIIVETPAEQRYISKKYSIPQRKVEVLPNGITYEENEVKSENPLGKNKKYVLQVGRFDKNKNQLNVIRAVNGTNIEMVFIGGAGMFTEEQEYYEKCINEAKGNKNIHFLGWLPHESNELQAWYEHADTLVVPSYYETFGMIVLEGGVRGAKLVLSKTIPITEYKEFSKCRTINPNDVCNIREELTKSLLDERNNDLKTEIINRFSWKAIIAKQINIYASTLNN